MELKLCNYGFVKNTTDRHVTIETNGNPYLHVNLALGIHIVKLDDNPNPVLYIFPYNENAEVRKIELNEFDVVSPDIAIRLFSVLLDYDGNRIPNRARNAVLGIIRDLCPENFKSSYGDGKEYSMKGGALTVYNKRGIAVISLGYSKFSKVIKDKL